MRAKLRMLNTDVSFLVSMNIISNTSNKLNDLAKTISTILLFSMIYDSKFKIVSANT